ncbi:uncharacterized protein B0P05DRAFT_456058, partial [Gilbertella persicaria]|uniref:uncharacterized protein n=1 Tax=Gilbertella persicaria TaxID=101096 RepID=UPI00221FAE3D
IRKMKDKLHKLKKKSIIQGKVKTKIKGGYFTHFILKTMDEMDCVAEMKGFFIVIHNALIYTVDTIEIMIIERGDKCL